MTPETVLRMIRDYGACKAKAVQLEGEIEIQSAQADHAKAREMAESALHGIILDDMPHGTTTGDPTGNLVARFLDGYQPQYLRDLDRDIATKRAQLREMQIVIRTVEGWLGALPERERFVITKHILEGEFWGEVVRLYEQRWGIITKEALKKAQKRALQRVYDIAR